MPRKLSETQQKRIILRVLAESDNLSQALKSAKLTRAQYRAMLASNLISEQELNDCKAEYGDRVLAAMNEMALHPPLVPLLSYGKPVLDDNGKPILYRNRDLNSLKALAERLQNSLDHAREAAGIENAIPDWARLELDIRQLKPDELAQLRTIAERLEASVKRHERYMRSKSNGYESSTEAELVSSNTNEISALTQSKDISTHD